MMLELCGSVLWQCLKEVLYLLDQAYQMSPSLKTKCTLFSVYLI